MATLNQIASSIASRLNKPFDKVLKERVKDSFRFIYAERIRQRVAKENIKDRYKLSYIASVGKVDEIDGCTISSGCNILRTDNKIPNIVDFKSDVPFTFVGTALHHVFVYARPYEVMFISSLPFNKNIIFYTYTNGYIYIYNNKLLKNIRVESIFSNPEDVINMCTDTCYDDDYDFPCPEDMIESITLEVFNTYAKLQSTDNTVHINEEDTRR